jgi:UDP-N-acetylmuramate dehydrogenase
MSLNIRENIELKAYTTLQTGGFARYLVEVASMEEVREAVIFAEQKSLPCFFLGTGSNVLVGDAGFSGVVILNKIKGLEYVEGEDGEVVLACGSGEVLDEVVEDTVARGLWGIENLSAIPGTVGATPVQNVGAYGVEVSEIISEVEAVNITDGSVKIFSNSECEFGYRNSFFKKENGKKYFITKVKIKLNKIPSPKISYADLANKFGDHTPTQQEIRESLISIRSEKFPDWRTVGTAGSFFKNPIITSEEASTLAEAFPEVPVYMMEDGMVKIPLGYLLDKVCGLKGYREGALGLYPAQALVLVNYGGATTKEIKLFAEKIIKIIFEKTKIKIEPEVRFIEVE